MEIVAFFIGAICLGWSGGWISYELGRRHERKIWQKGLDDMGIKK